MKTLMAHNATGRDAADVGPRNTVTTSKAKRWGTKWDKKCKAPFTEYKPSKHPRLS